MRIIGLLYEASQAGVEIEVVVRGVCCLRAGVPGLSERISVKSVVGRFLEHSRVFCFGNGGPLPGDVAEVFLCSADLMPHKLDQRIEMLVPIRDVALRRRLQREIFIAYARDAANSWTLNADDQWIRQPRDGYNVHEALFNDGSASV
jgi:polyphosphate kinase